jgi:hypothetical protein
MASDYNRYRRLEFFNQRVQQYNPDLKNGVTGYE